ncbi:uncharacterized protein Z518_07981 [Rhinocladiella mackenziei CBS 650.93]|uniref:Cytochrome b561 domain-containing protein n=1 Tax=Rhinocladiella mackenziei CBS 650.93 TaxID=1442369 RepID=A0A0D2FJD8_9EURO|nr:uncharacterized protein Z518_07981 [Rhinocladiella mackenziei CBS 650.93]KIX02042.1 hypothetical protein Z518_07981 [Rhinocladiella mackenziei CBS 650.93]
MHRSLSLPALLAVIAYLTSIVLAYRPVQFVKHTGQSGRADQAFSLVNYYNESTQQSDLYVRMEAFRYKSLAQGWAALALGPEMKGALMFIIYGDPSAPDSKMTTTVRTVDGHHPPRPAEEMKDFYSGYIPEVDIVTSRFEKYTGEFFHEALQLKPSHLGVAEFIVHGFDKWTAPDLAISNTTTNQAMIWSSNFEQDFEGDFSPERNIDMHQFGLGFGFIWADLLNAQAPIPFFGPINDLIAHRGVDEINEPSPPTEEELQDGETIIAEKTAALESGNDAPITEGGSSESEVEPVDKGSSTDTPGPDDGSQVEEPVKTPKQWNIRSFMWHLHGLLMTISFLVLYPLGIYLLRSPRPTAFNLHWTVNSLGSVSVGISALIGFVNSHSISIFHQYLGILLVCALAAQTVLGWRHHVVYISAGPLGGRPTWMSQMHVWLGRIVLPFGMLNTILGLLLRHYGWLTISLTIALASVEIIVLTLIVGRARSRRPVTAQKAPTADEAEEYFQLAGDEDGEFSDEDEEAAGGATGAEERERKQREKEDQQKRLAKLDRV